MNSYKCGNCDTEGLEEGFIEDTGRYSAGYARWINAGAERGILGSTKQPGKQIEAHRCPTCGHLELFAPNPRPPGWRAE